MSQMSRPTSVLDAIEALLPKLADHPRHLGPALKLLREDRKRMSDEQETILARMLERHGKAKAAWATRLQNAPVVVVDKIGPDSVPGSHKNEWRVLPFARRNRMMRWLYEGGFTMEEIADFTRENAHRTTVSRAITGKT